MSSETYGHVQFETDDWRKLQEYCDLCPVEVAAMGYATLEDNIVKVNEVFLVPQTVSGTSVEFMSTGFPWAVNKALKEGRIDELRFCWHSHVNFGAFFSSTDKDMVRKVRDHGPIPWFASVVLNKKGETHAQLDYFHLGEGVGNFCQHLTLELDVAIGEIPEDDTEIREEELSHFLTMKKTTVSKTKTVTTTSGKSPATKADEKLDEQVGPSGCTGADWRLHNQARAKGWASYMDPEHYVHYWDESDGNKYKGCAPMPKNPDGSFKLNIEFSVIDSDTVDEIEEHFGPRDQDDIDEAVERVMARDEGRILH